MLQTSLSRVIAVPPGLPLLCVEKLEVGSREASPPLRVVVRLVLARTGAVHGVSGRLLKSPVVTSPTHPTLIAS